MKHLKNRNDSLILIDVQEGFKDPFWGKRNNPSAEVNIQAFLRVFREKKFPVIHVQHLSTDPLSPLYPSKHGVNFMAEVQPRSEEMIIQKSVHSAFINTNLESHLRSKNIQNIVFVGFTTDHCISTNTRMASNLGFNVTVISDATMTFDRMSTDGTFYPAQLVHDIHLATLNGEFAKILTTIEYPIHLPQDLSTITR